MTPISKYRNTRRKVKITNDPTPLHTLTCSVYSAMSFAVHVYTQAYKSAYIVFKKHSLNIKIQ